ncbi:MAG: histidine kinase [Oscillospiraceae bacterium]|nr:histidine kinase [Oscillospiraceae bacterium]
MKLKIKTLVIYMCCALLIIASASYAFYLYTSRLFINNTHAGLISTANRIAHQIDYQIIHMDFALRSLMSDRLFVQAVTRMGLGSGSSLDAQNTIINSIYKESFIRTFYRVNYFNRNHDFFTSRIYNRDTVSRGNDAILESMSWLPNINNELPNPLITPSHNDPWLVGREIPVFSVLRALRGYGTSIGYLEVQMTIEQLEEILLIEDSDNIYLIVTTRHNEIIYHNLYDDTYALHYFPFFEEALGGILLAQSSEAVTKIITTYRGTSGVGVMLIQDQDALLAPFANLGRLIFIASIILLLVAFIYGYLYSSRLIRAKNLQMQANFNLLQTQINPHFIYNTLNVISGRGLSLGDESIGDICENIAHMLRYSVSTEEKTALMSDEINHVSQYLHLQKTRYEHRLTYSIQVSEDLLNMQVPKIVLQPFVENSIAHGYKNGTQSMNISITGQKDNDHWCITISDDGGGFTGDSFKKLNESISEVVNSKKPLELSLGKMGIVNTFVRLRLFYKDFRLTFGNNPTGGAFVELHGRS